MEVVVVVVAAKVVAVVVGGGSRKSWETHECYPDALQLELLLAGDTLRVQIPPHPLPRTNLDSARIKRSAWKG